MPTQKPSGTERDTSSGESPPSPTSVVVLLDSSLERFDYVWAAAGTPHSVMRLRVSELAEIVGGGFADLAK